MIIGSGTIEGSQLVWSLTSGGVLTISGTGAMPDNMYPWPWDALRPNIKSVVIENGVTDIGGAAFYNCNELTSVVIPADVQSVGQSAFGGCLRLASINIPEGVISIGRAAFADCNSLTSMIIPASVTSIGEGVFSNCANLLSIDVDPLNTHYILDGAALYDTNKTILLAYPAKNVNTTYTIPNGVKAIGHGAFSQCANLTEIIIPVGVTRIGFFAFDGCRSLNSINIPDGVTYIGGYAFYGSRSLTSITIPASVTFIGAWAFTYSALTSIIIPADVTDIGEGLFADCTNLSSVDVDPLNADYLSEGGVLYNKAKTVLLAYPVGNSAGSFDIPNGIQRIGNGAFTGCTNLTSVVIPESVTEIGSWTFSNCTNLASITIPDGVTRIENNAFSGCTNLASITIPGSVASIESYAFGNCTGLTDVTVQWANPISITSYVFPGVNLSNVILHVPKDTKADYEAADVWKDFGTIQEEGTIIATENEPVVAGAKGNVTLSLSVPTGATITGTFVVKLIPGMSLDTEHTKLADELASNFELTIIKIEGENAWRFTISAKPGTSASLRVATQLTNIMNIAYTVAADLADGDYDIVLENLDFTLSDNTPIREDVLTVTVKVDRTAAISVTGVTLDQTTLAAVLGDAPVTLIATITPADATNKNVTWSTSNAAVTTVSNGTVTFVGAGSATITVTTDDGGKTITCTVVVTASTDPDPDSTDPDIYVTGVSLNHITLAGKAGDTAVELVATITPGNATDQDVTWSTSNPSVATVDNGTVNFVGVGTATITVTTVDGGYTATCVVAVSTATGTEGIDAALKVYFRNHTLYISSPTAETIEVYSFSGTCIFSAREAAFTVPTNQKAVIVRDSSGWTRKTANN
ncbi:hypothetical protein FACS1894181_15470 [Bacteroidia bacterium]|nr:hypothetical protein FACS1894181_15470 [Bacteroidia bacterium]